MGQASTPGSALHLPEIDSDRCVLGAVVAASCRACVEVCPRSALVVSDDALGLDTAACDGCGLCAPACPEWAIAVPRPQPIRAPDEPATMLLACERAITGRGKGVLACLHAIGMDALARHHRDGVRRIVAARADCAACPRGRSRTFDAGLEGLARLLADRRLPGMALEEPTAQRWIEARNAASAPSRRGLLNAFRTAAGLPADQPMQPAAALLPPGAPPAAALNPFLPVIDAARCVACDACARVCPHDAIRLETSASTAYLTEPPRCTGCGLCADVCAEGAVEVRRWRAGTGARLGLDAQQCASCGNVFRTIAGRHSASTLCRICARQRPNRNLFQVIE